MTKLLFVHICESAFITAESKNLNIIGIFENINAKSFPAVYHKFSVVTQIQSDIAGDYEQSLIITNQKSEEEIIRIGGRLNIATPDGKAIFIGNFVMVNFPLPGKYLINILVDGGKLGEIEFNAKQV